ncbi:nuclear exosome regulator NRDE2 [Brassica rapa]|uniref:Uncharacterized protein n=1 Tax=Brassica campestris TaxID=3711 RepID=M4CG19_BRACM|nr:nuclear exosome regulator NRDE2 [Brassica rapa]
MSLDHKDAESHLTSTSASSSNKCCNNGSSHFSGTGSDDAQESDGDDSGGYIHQYVNEDSKYIIKPILKSSVDDGEGEDKKNLATAESMTAVTVIPAIKGSREKYGKPLEKLSVSWAEDVYDPPPSLVSHTRSKKQQPQKSKSRDSLKKNGKKGQKGSSNSSSSSSRGSKDKKSSSSRSKHSRDNKFGWATQTSIVAASS